MARIITYGESRCSTIELYSKETIRSKGAGEHAFARCLGRDSSDKPPHWRLAPGRESVMVRRVMNSLFNILQLRAVPASANLALLALRVWLGLSMLLLHGWAKVVTFSTLASHFPDPFGLGSKTTLILAIFGEVACSALLTVGLFTRLAALGCAAAMATAFFAVHNSQFTGQHGGELAFIYLAGFVALVLAGGGRFSVDATSHGPAGT
jgi:putative oxidoreductase